MAEQIGVIVKAGDEMKADQSGTVFKMGVDKFTYSLFDTKLQAIAKENLGKRVKVTYNQSADGKYRNVESIELAKDSEASTIEQPKQWYGKSPEEIASIEAQVAAKITAELLIAEKIAYETPPVIALWIWLRQKLEAAIVKPLSKVATPIKDKAIDTPRQAEEEAPKFALERFKDECKRNGWDFKTKAGGDKIAAWLMEHFHMMWKELSEEAQEKAIEQMSQEAGEKEG